MHKSIVRVSVIASGAFTYLVLASNVFAQYATVSAGRGGGGGTSSSLPSAGSTDLTYILFLGGAVLFVVGMLKLISSYRD